MSDINLDFTVSNNSINFTVEPNDITITPTDVQLNFSSNTIPIAGGSNASVQYNNDGLLDGGIGLTWNNLTSTLTTPNLIANGNVEFGDVSNVHIQGGTNGYVLQTDGTGNLAWTAQTGGGGNGSPGGANTQIQFNDGGLFGGNVGFTFNKTTGNVALPNNAIVTGTVQANLFSGNGAYLVNIPGANVTGQVANALVAGTVYTNAQPNITSVGTLSSLSVSGNISTTGTTSIQQAQEKVVVSSSPATGTINYDILTSAIILNTANATANFTLNFRGNSTTTLNSVMSSNQSMTCTFINKNGANAYIPTQLQIDGSNITPVWTGTGSPAPGTPTGRDSYTFNIIKTASATYTVFASRVGYL